jgi:hypothetical protein
MNIYIYSYYMYVSYIYVYLFIYLLIYLSIYLSIYMVLFYSKGLICDISSDWP